MNESNLVETIKELPDGMRKKKKKKKGKERKDKEEGNQ